MLLHISSVPSTEESYWQYLYIATSVALIASEEIWIHTEHNHRDSVCSTLWHQRVCTYTASRCTAILIVHWIERSCNCYLVIQGIFSIANAVKIQYLLPVSKNTQSIIIYTVQRTQHNCSRMTCILQLRGCTYRYKQSFPFDFIIAQHVQPV